MKPLIIGQAPGPNTDPAVPLGGRCGDRLAEICGLELDAFHLLFERVNLLNRFPGKAAKGDLFPLDEARYLAGRLLINGDLRDRTVVLLGENVARAFFLPPGTKTLAWLPGLALERLAISPHPSGVNRWWNDSTNLRRARRFWRRLTINALAGELSPKSPDGRS